MLDLTELHVYNEFEQEFVCEIGTPHLLKIYRKLTLHIFSVQVPYYYLQYALLVKLFCHYFLSFSR